MVELLLHHEAYNLVTQSLGKYNFDQQHSAGGSQQDRSDSIIKSHKLQDMCVSSHIDKKMCLMCPRNILKYSKEIETSRMVVKQRF